MSDTETFQAILAEEPELRELTADDYLELAMDGELVLADYKSGRDFCRELGQAYEKAAAERASRTIHPDPLDDYIERAVLRAAKDSLSGISLGTRLAISGTGFVGTLENRKFVPTSIPADTHVYGTLASIGIGGYFHASGHQLEQLWCGEKPTLPIEIRRGVTLRLTEVVSCRDEGFGQAVGKSDLLVVPIHEPSLTIASVHEIYSKPH